jgi:hypothetical protein
MIYKTTIYARNNDENRRKELFTKNVDSFIIQ